MNRLLFLFFTLCLPLLSRAENKFVVDKIDIKPGEEKTVSVSLTNEDDAKSAAIDISLPAGLSFVGTNASVEFSSRVASMASKSAKIQTSGALRIGLLGLGGVIEAGEGEIFTFKIKADESTTVGSYQISYSTMSVTYATKVTIPDMTTDVNVYNIVDVTVVSADEKMGTVTGGGTQLASGTEITVKAEPKTGYNFVAWFDGETQVSTNAEYKFTVTKTVTLTAKFEIQKFKIIFYQEDGTTKIEEKTYDYNAAITAPTAPNKVGWTFKAWDPAVPTNALADGSYKATYTINKYKVKFVKDDGTTLIKEEEMEYGKPITAPTAPTKDGHTFKAWDPAVDATVPAQDVTYKATYDVNKYKVHFTYKVDEDNNTTKDEEWAYGTVIKSDMLPAIPTIEGMPFLKWQDGEGNKLEVGTTTVPAKEVTYTAQYDVEQIKITYKIDDKTEVKEVGYKTPIPAVDDPTKEGYKFIGWTWTKTSDNSPLGDMVGQNMPSYELTATANFEIQQFTVKFFEEDGTTQIGTDITDEYNKAITAPGAAAKTGYTFDGWTIIGGDGTVLASVDKIPGANTSYKAHYLVNKHNITYKVDGEFYQEVKDVAYGTELTPIEKPTKEGYTFDEAWTGLPDLMPDEDVIVTGEFHINQYTIAFVTLNEDGSVKETIQSTTQDYATDIVAPNAADAAIFAKLNREEEGWIWKGWALQEAPETPVDVAAKVPANNLTYVAYYVPNIVNVIYIVDGDTLTTVTVDYKAALPEDPEPEKEGYTFSGWTTWRDELNTKQYEAKPATMPAENVVAEGSFLVNQYCVTFISEEEIISEEWIDFGEPIVPPTSPEKRGHDFAGWTPAIPDAVPAHDVTFYAQFKPLTYTITYILDGEEYQSVETPYAAEITPLVVEKEGYTFSGWLDLPETMPARNVKAFGSFYINQYRVTFIGGGVIAKEEMLDYGTPIEVPEAPAFDGMRFVEWADLLETVPAYDVVFDAVYEEVETIEPVEEATKVDFAEALVDETGEPVPLENAVVNNTYYNFDPAKGDGYDTTEKCLVLNTSTSTEQMAEVVEAELGSSSMANNFAGIVLSVKGEGSMEIDCQTIGAKELFVKVGDAEPQVFKKNDRGLAEIIYNAAEDTPVYIYASSSTGTETADDALKIWSVNIVPGPVTPVAIKTVREAIEKGSAYTIDGRKLNTVPTKKGFYIINGKKMFIK